MHSELAKNILLIVDRGHLLIDMPFTREMPDPPEIQPVTNLLAFHVVLPAATSRRSGSFVGVWLGAGNTLRGFRASAGLGCSSGCGSLGSSIRSGYKTRLASERRKSTFIKGSGPLSCQRILPWPSIKTVACNGVDSKSSNAW